MKLRLLFILLFLPILSICNQFYVSPNGHAQAQGTEQDPWDLQTALNHPVIVKPGDTIWLRGGRYLGNPDTTEVAGFISRLTGSENQPIIVRQFPGERAVLDGINRQHPVSDPPANDSYILGILGNYSWFWGFEVCDSHIYSRSDSSSGFRWRVNSIISNAKGIRLINLIIHDTGSGLGPFSGCVGCELYGNIIYYNGWSHLGVRGHGEGVYGQNKSPTKFLRDNVIFKQFDSGIILYGTTNSTIDNFHIEGNVVFENGVINDQPNGWGFLFGKNGTASGRGTNFVIQNNYLYNRFDYLRSNNMDLAYQSGLKDVVLKDNYSVGRWAIRCEIPIEGLTAYDNTFVGEINPISTTQISADSNSIFSPFNVPKENSVFIRSNLYEPGRAHIICYNWLDNDAIEIDLSLAGLMENQAFEIIDIQDLFGAKVYSGRFNSISKTIQLPMKLNKVTSVIGQNVPRPAKHTDPVFNVFLLKPIQQSVSTNESESKKFMAQYRSSHRILAVLAPNYSNWHLNLINLQGQQLAETQFNGNTKEWDIPLLPKGVYILELFNDSEKHQTKIEIY